MNNRSPLGSLRITADGDGLISRSGTALIGDLAARLCFSAELSKGLAHLHSRTPTHDPAQVLLDLATALIDGGECVSDLGALAEQPDLFGEVASHSTATRVLEAIGEAEREALFEARRAARERAWAAGSRPGRITLDFDAQLLECHTEKEGAAPHRKGGFGYHPLHCFLDETGEHLAAMLRPGNAGANDASDHVEVLDRALAQLPEAPDDFTILARADTAGQSHGFAAALRQRGIRFSLGYAVTERVGAAALSLPERRWKPALDADGKPREGAWVAELTDRVELSAWPEGTRLICRRERPHPGAQLRFTDPEGHRYQCFITDQRGRSLAELELRHRLHARVEDRVQESQELGLGRLPFQDWDRNQVWLCLAELAGDLLAWLRSLVLEGELSLAKPRRLRHRLLHVAGRITRSGRRRILHLPRAWPWAAELLLAFQRLRALPAPA
ncbi:MAG TPA: IS1380 family transposase [Solirubrobacterales bacterium]|nr:IS1380 family transposase [Solirubrobacterales bacterium]